MSKPAARMGDMTSHGGVIVVGQPTVLIGGMPAARAADMHACPMFNGPQPHVGGPVAMGSTGVLIGGMPAARMGDMAICAGPPDPIVMGCFTVLIGETMPGGGGGGAGAGAPGAAGANASAAAAQFDNNESTTKEEHWVEFKFVDAAGLPVSGVPYAFEDPDGNVSEGVLRMDGTVRRDALSEGQAEVTLKEVYNARWSKEEARFGETVEMKANVTGMEGSETATVEVWKRDLSGPDVQIVTYEGESVKGDEISKTWKYEYLDKGYEDKDRSRESYSQPVFYFVVRIGQVQARSDMLEHKDYVEVELKDSEDQPIKGAKYRAVLPNGEVREGTLDNKGYAEIEEVPPGKWDVTFPEHEKK